MKQSFLAILMFFLCISGLFSIVIETDSFQQFMYGTAENCEYDDWISHIAKGVAVVNYNLYAPFYRQTSGFGDFKIATTQELNNWNHVVETFIAGNYASAQDLINQYEFPYTVVQFNDIDTGRTYYMLRENLNYDYFDDQGTPETTDDVEGSFDYGWGLYVVWPEAPKPIIVNVVHPNDDFIVPPLAVKAFQDWDAKYFMMAGAGREVKWTNVAPYWNSKSLSDPSRVVNHPFNRFYYAACNDIRDGFGRREYSAQLHSYDWNRHVGAANNQISGGPNTLHPNLPIRDLSSRKMDLINQTDYLVWPENSIGIHEPVYINDYYAVYYNPNEEPFYFDDGEVYVPVNNYITLPGYAENVQFLYTNAGRNRYDVVDHFFHIEFDELPNCYPQNENNYFWFYGYDLQTNSFDMSRRYENALLYYGKLIDIMKPVLFEALALNDNEVPGMPQNLNVLGTELNRVTLGWDPIDHYDFETYEIYYSTQANDNQANLHDRTTDTKLASIKTNRTNINNLQAGNTYYAKIRAKDYNGNYSNISEEITFTMGPANISSFNCYSLDAKTFLSWTATSQALVQGYRIYRSENNSPLEMIADWNSHAELLKTANTQAFNFIDITAQDFSDYQYRIAMVDLENQEYLYYMIGESSPRPTHKIILENSVGTIQDSIFVGYSPFATDGQDTFYDVVKTGTLPPQYVEIILFEQNWSNQGVRLSREIHAEFNPNLDFKYYRVRVRSNQTNLKIRLDNTQRHSEKVILVDPANNQYRNLLNQEYNFTVSNTNYKDFHLYVGNVQPVANITNAFNRVLQAGDMLNISLTTTYPALLDHYKVSLISETDSLLINNNSAPTNQTVSFLIPDDVIIHNANVAFDAYCVDGEIIRYLSSWKIGIVPGTSTFSYLPGNNFIANPFPTNPISLESINPEATLYQLSEQQWSESSDLLFGTGYLLNIPEDFTQSYTYSVQKNIYSKALSQGWNLIANPHLRDFNIKDLDFSINNQAFTYGELFQQNILMPVVRVVRDNQYSDTDFVYAGESFLIYANINSADNFVIQFTPYKNNLPVYADKFDWQGLLNVAYYENERITDEIMVSVSKNYDQNYFSLHMNNPEPIKLPEGISFYMRESATAQEKFNSRTIGLLSESIEDFIQIPFTIEIPSLEMLKFSYSNNISTLNYQMVLVLEDQEYPFTVNTLVSYMPTDLIINGYIKIVNDFLVPDSDQTIKPLSVTTYPNPFNPTTNISFNLPTSTLVELNIYNIKGQKVNTLRNEFMDKGNHVVTWNGIDHNGKQCGSGIYFVSVNAKDYNRIMKKITLIK